MSRRALPLVAIFAAIVGYGAAKQLDAWLACPNVSLLALAISLEEEDERVYADFAEAARLALPASAAKSSTPCGKRNRIIAAD